MQIGILQAREGNRGTFYVGELELMDHAIEVAMGPNPLKGTYEGAADYEFRFPRSNWNKAGNASVKTSKRTGMNYIKGAIVQQGVGTVYVNLYEVFDDKAKDDKKGRVVAYNVHYTGDSVASARRRAGAPSSSHRSTGNVPDGAPIDDKIPY